MINTNQMKIDFDHEAIARNFAIFEARRDQGNYKRSRVPDVALQQCRALAVAYDWGECCYILYERGAAEKNSLKQTLEGCEDNVQVREITSQKLAEKQGYLLAQLLCNAIPSLEANGEMYHNVTGKLYYLDPKWVYQRKGQLASFWALQISFTKDYCVKLEVRTFSNILMRQDLKKQPQYLFDPKSYALRRALKEESSKSGDRFVIGALNPKRKHTVPFLDFGSLAEYRSCKVGILHRFLQDVQLLLVPYLTLTVVSLDESTHIGSKSTGDSMAGIRNRLKSIPIYLADTVKNDQSRALISALCQELEKYYGITLTDGTPKKGAVLLRIIHNQEFYEEGPEKDAYWEAPKDCIVQHMTVEDFHLTGMNRFGTKEKEDHNLRKIIQELAIKMDVYQRQMACYDWSELGFSSPITFVTATWDYKDKSKPICYYMLRVLPSGELRFETWMQSLLWDSSEREKIAVAFETPNGKFDFHVKGLVYEDVDNIHVIYDTDRYTLPNMGDLEQILGATRDDERVIVKPITDAIQEYSDTLSGPKKVQCQEIFDAVSRCGFQASRKELRLILNLRSKLGKQVNRFIFEKTGILIGSGLKSTQNQELLFGGVLGIRHFCEGDSQYYYAGYLGKSLNRSLPHACRIRKVRSTGHVLQFPRYLPLLEVDFVRVNGWTVIPFPFKYLREWKALQK